MEDIPFLETLAEEERRFKNFRIAGTGNVIAFGDEDGGYGFNTEGTKQEEGACCDGEDCTSVTEDDCDDLGGVYHGDGVPCDPNPCAPPTGACCYDDGTCDDITEAECDEAEGTFQGVGTTCADTPCTGACCEPGCVEDTTPDGCDLDGGTFQGFGSTCDPDPCTTGACCDGGDCSITTEEDCTGDYQGDGTTCDPNPCMPECSCGFDAFDGSGRKFLTEIDTVYSRCPCCDASGACGVIEGTMTWTIDPVTCDITSVGGPFCAPPGGTCTGDCYGYVGYTINCPSACEIPPFLGGGFTEITHTATYLELYAAGDDLSFDCDGNTDPMGCDGPTACVRTTATLSNECTPI